MAIQLKAAFLLIAFSMDMLIGFSGVIGINMSFNAGRANGGAAPENSYHHGDADKHHKSKGCTDNYCNNQFIRFSQDDKSLPRYFAGFHAIFLATLFSSFSNTDVLHTSKALLRVKYFVRTHHPPIPDIRLAVQSSKI